jgi:hypothetical protein
MTREQKQRLQSVAEAFIRELPAEYIEIILSDPSFVVPFEKPATRPFAAYAGISSRRMAEIENTAIAARNSYYTALLREELKKIYKKTQ